MGLRLRACVMAVLVQQSSRVLAFLDEESVAALENYGTTRNFQPGEVFIKEGQEQTSFYIIVSGSLEVVASVSGQQIKLSDLQAGDCFGEVAIFQPGVASASVQSLSEGTLWHQDANQLQGFLEAFPFPGSALLLGINLVLSERVTHANGIIKTSSIAPSFLSVRGRFKSRLSPNASEEIKPAS